MSTRSQIGFYSEPTDDLSTFEALLYRHSDGYPGAPIEDGPGVLPDILPFLKWFTEVRGNDPEYAAARLLQHLANVNDSDARKLDAEFDTSNIRPKAGFTYDVTGLGVCTRFHGDIAYYYAVFPDYLDVYEVGSREPQTFTRIGRVSQGKMGYHIPAKPHTWRAETIAGASA